jgi:hypothetical protein
MSYGFGWGFSDQQSQIYPLTDMATMYATVAPLKPKYWRLTADWSFIAKAQAPGTAVSGVPPTTSNRDWSEIDRTINDIMLTVGSEIVMVIGQARPSWSSGGGVFLLFGFIPIPFLGGGTGVTATDYGNFCAEVAARYKPGGVGIRTDGIYAPNAGKGVTKFEIWNEQNNKGFWGSNVSAADYVAYLKAAYVAIKGVSGLAGTNSTVIFGGLQHVPRTGPWYGYGWETIDEVGFLTNCYATAGTGAAALGNFYDAMAEHVYPSSDTSTYVAGSTAGPAPDMTTDNMLQLVAIRALMVTHLDGAKPIFITECGYPTSAVTQAQQSTYMQQLFANLNTLSYVTMVLIYNARDVGTDLKSDVNTFGMESYGFVAKTIWTWLQTLSPVIHAFSLAVTPSIAAAGATGFRSAFSLAVTPSIAMVGAERYAAGFALAVTPSIAMVASDRERAAFALTVTPSLTLAAAPPGVGTFGLTVAPALAMVGAERYAATFGLAVTPTIAMLGADRESAAFALAVTPTVALAGAGRSPATFGLTATPSIGMAGVAVAPAAVTRVALGTSQIATGTGTSRTITIPVTVPSGYTAANLAMVCSISVGHNGWIVPGSYGGLTAVGSVDGALARNINTEGSNGPSGQETGSDAILTKIGLTPGAQNVVVTFTPGSFDADQLVGNVAIYAGVKSIANATKVDHVSGTISLPVTTVATGDMAVCSIVSDATQAVAAGAATTVDASGAANAAGSGDFQLLTEQAGPAGGGTVTFTTTGTRTCAAGALVLRAT